MKDISTRISDALNIRNMKPIELAEKTGIPKSSISQYMTGHVKPKNDRIYLIAKALNVDETWLLGYDVPMERKNPEEVGETLAQVYFEKDLLDHVTKLSKLPDSEKQLVYNMIDTLFEKQ